MRKLLFVALLTLSLTITLALLLSSRSVDAQSSGEDAQQRAAQQEKAQGTTAGSLQKAAELAVPAAQPVVAKKKKAVAKKPRAKKRTGARKRARAGAKATKQAQPAPQAPTPPASPSVAAQIGFGLEYTRDEGEPLFFEISKALYTNYEAEMGQVQITAAVENNPRTMGMWWTKRPFYLQTSSGAAIGQPRITANAPVPGDYAITMIFDRVPMGELRDGNLSLSIPELSDEGLGDGWFISLPPVEGEDEAPTKASDESTAS